MNELLINALIPAIVTLVFIACVVWKNRILSFFKHRSKNKLQLDFEMKIGRNFRFDLGDWKYTVLIPIILSYALDFLLIYLTKTGWAPYDEPFWYLVTVRSFLNPVSEEVLIRGFIFGAMLLTTMPIIEKLVLKKSLIFSSKFWVITSLILQTVYFAIQHQNPDLPSLLVRLSSGLLYGILYLAYGKNLLPPIVAHITHNLAVTFMKL